MKTIRSQLHKLFARGHRLNENRQLKERIISEEYTSVSTLTLGPATSLGNSTPPDLAMFEYEVLSAPPKNSLFERNTTKEWVTKNFEGDKICVKQVLDLPNKRFRVSLFFDSNVQPQLTEIETRKTQVIGCYFDKPENEQCRYKRDSYQIEYKIYNQLLCDYLISQRHLDNVTEFLNLYDNAPKSCHRDTPIINDIILNGSYSEIPKNEERNSLKLK